MIDIQGYLIRINEEDIIKRFLEEKLCDYFYLVTKQLEKKVFYLENGNLVSEDFIAIKGIDKIYTEDLKKNFYWRKKDFTKVSCFYYSYGKTVGTDFINISN